MKTTYLYILTAVVVFAFAGCERKPTDPGLQYAPQMYVSLPLEPYSQTHYNELTKDIFKHGRTSLDPVPGTVARGKADYYYPYYDSPEGLAQAAAELKNPYPFTKASADEGKRIYTYACAHCHGKDGKGDGEVPAKSSYGATPPNYDSDKVREMTEGHLYHRITFGLNAMGPHGTLISPEERWRIIHYIRTVRGEKPIDAAAPAAAVADSTKAPADSTKMTP